MGRLLLKKSRTKRNLYFSFGNKDDDDDDDNDNVDDEEEILFIIMHSTCPKAHGSNNQSSLSDRVPISLLSTSR